MPHTDTEVGTLTTLIPSWSRFLSAENSSLRTIVSWARLRPPKLDERRMPVVADHDLKTLFKACVGKSFEDRRDTAIIPSY